MKTGNIYGVSPAWFLSLFGEDFSCIQAADSLSLLKDLGFDSWQPEIFKSERLKEWRSPASHELHARSRDLGLIPSQFVAHFLLHGFESELQVHSSWGLDETEELLDILENWPEIKVITLPMPGFWTDGGLTPDVLTRSYDATLKKLLKMVQLVEHSGRTCALEIMPEALIGGSDGFLRLKQVRGFEQLGINLDTGHFHAMGENLNHTLSKLNGSITGSHLCDNDGKVNKSMEPGWGTVTWEAFGSWYTPEKLNFLDIEIRCPAPETEERYKRGLDFLKNLIPLGLTA